MVRRATACCVAPGLTGQQSRFQALACVCALLAVQILIIDPNPNSFACLSFPPAAHAAHPGG